LAKRASVITVNLVAGTATFSADMEKAKAKVREFGAHSVTGVQAASGAIRTLEGNVQNNVRAVERFLVTTLHLGPVLQAAFPLVGAIAFAGMITKIGEEIHEFFKEISQAPEKIAGAFRELNAPLKSTNDQLLVTNDRLANDIAKLEGRRQNTLKLALDEARAAADRLADSLAKDLSGLNKLLTEQNVGAMRRLFGEAGTTDIKEEFGGKTGFGGMAGDIAQINEDAQKKIDAAIKINDLKAVEAARTELNTNLLRRYNRELDQLNIKLDVAKQATVPRTITKYDPMTGRAAGTMTEPAPDQTARIEELAGAIRAIEEQKRGVGIQGANTDLIARKEAAEAANANAQLDRPFRDRMNALNATLEGVKAKLLLIGEGEAVQAVAKGFEASLKAIEEVNKSLESHHTKLTDAEMGQISLRQQQIASAEGQVTWRTKLDETTKRIADEVVAQEMLTAAIGKGYEAMKKANVEAQLMKSLGAAKYNELANSGGLAPLRAAQGSAYDATATATSTAATNALREQAQSETTLAKVQAQGAEASRLATLQAKLQKLAKDGVTDATKLQIQATIDQYNAERDLVAAGELATLNAKIRATKALSAAQIEGAEAARKAGLESKYSEMGRNGVDSGVIAKTKEDDRLQNEQRVAEEALKGAYVYKDELEKLNLQVEALKKIQAEGKGNLAITLELRKLDDARLKTAVQQQLAMGTAKDGVKAFFLEMQQQAKKSSEIIYETLSSAVDRVSENLAKLFTRQKTSFGKMFQDLGDQMLQSTIKSGIQKGLGALGKVFGIDVPQGKPDGTKSNPIWIRDAGGSGPFGSGGVGTPGGGGPGTILGGSAGGGIFNFLGGLFGATPHAGGGSVSPGSAYLVGEDGPEILLGASGRIASNSESRGMLGGGRSNHFYSIDARGTDPVLTEQRTRAGIMAAHTSAVATGVRVQAERLKRMPSRN
jgi:hypothetical protein